ncbi:amidohydrolase family protein [Nocardioides carbamazepini]|uniref:amidohydrolase family protein n=1 Tax=Nocardioides carbamazepini TaxID=2854259 RepID=UPI00214A2F15|nr:amidohydrolase family protein [Nocardioides carbamazepini]MCR1784115.1 amidohydrolase family protein [Nocardioides carbamazepini]
MHSVTPFTPGSAVVDLCDVVLRREGWRAYLGALLTAAPRYGEVFAGRFAAMSGRSSRDVLAALAEDPAAAIEDLAEVAARAFDPQARAAELEEHDIVQVIHGGPWPCAGGTMNDHVADVARLSDRFVPWAGVSLADPAAAVAEAVRTIDELGMSGLSVIPFLDGVDPSDPALDGLWSTAAERDVPVWIHSGQNFSSSPMAISGPQVIDALAVRHPHLRMVLGHGGWPWVLEAVALLQRHPHVYLEFSSHHPRTMAAAGSGWEPLFLHGSRSVRDRVLFGSTSWTHTQGLAAVVESVSALPIAPDVRDAWLRGNAARLLARAVETVG